MKKMVWLAVLPLLLSAAESPGRTPEPNRTPEALPLYPKGAPESNGLSADSVKVLPDVIFGAVDADYLVLPADPTQATGQAVSRRRIRSRLLRSRRLTGRPMV